ncbi:MAG: hypothetical protein GC202_01060 [Alphaproteobacteria bacterium]|nr:hypothetical protein [Alphaproteobacteria bacterium]
MKRLLPALAVAAAIAGLSACSSKEPVTAECPRGGIVPDANTLVRFRDGPGRDITDVLLQAQVVDMRITCEYAKGRNARPAVTLDLQIAFAAERGPAERTRKASAPYFVAIVDPDHNIVAKETFSADFEWTDNRPRTGRVDQWEPFIPLKNNFDGPSYQILVGFQLSEDQLAWNRKQRGAK